MWAHQQDWILAVRLRGHDEPRLSSVIFSVVGAISIEFECESIQRRRLRLRGRAAWGHVAVNPQCARAASRHPPVQPVRAVSSSAVVLDWSNSRGCGSADADPRQRMSPVVTPAVHSEGCPRTTAKGTSLRRRYSSFTQLSLSVLAANVGACMGAGGVGKPHRAPKHCLNPCFSRPRTPKADELGRGAALVGHLSSALTGVAVNFLLQSLFGFSASTPRLAP